MIFQIKQIIYKIANNMIDNDDFLYDIIIKYENLIGDTSYIQKSFLKNIDNLFDVIINFDKLKNTSYDKNFEKENLSIYHKINNISKNDDLNNFLIYYLLNEMCIIIDDVKIKNKVYVIHLFIDLIKYFYLNYNMYVQIKLREMSQFYNSMHFNYIDRDDYVTNKKNKDITLETLNELMDGEITYGMYDEVIDEENEKNINDENDEMTNMEDAIDFGTEDNFVSLYNSIN